MDSNHFSLNQNGILMIDTPTGESIQIDGSNSTNSQVIAGVINTRLDFINPQIGAIKKRIAGTVNLSPIEQAEFDFLKLRISNLEEEKNSLLNLVSQLNSNIDLADPRQNNSRITKLKEDLKHLIADSKVEDLYEKVKGNVKSSTEIFNRFVTVFSRYGTIKSENLAGTIPREDYSISMSQISFSLLALVDELAPKDLKP